MAATVVKCAKLGQNLPGIDPDTAEGRQALKLSTMIAGKEFAEKVRNTVSAKAWDQWKDHMVMVMNEYRLDPMNPESYKVLKAHLEAFFFGEQKAVESHAPGTAAEEQRSRPALEMFDPLDSPEDDHDLDDPEDEETEPGVKRHTRDYGVDACPALPEHSEEHIEC